MAQIKGRKKVKNTQNNKQKTEYVVKQIRVCVENPRFFDSVGGDLGSAVETNCTEIVALVALSTQDRGRMTRKALPSPSKVEERCSASTLALPGLSGF